MKCRFKKNHFSKTAELGDLSNYSYLELSKKLRYFKMNIELLTDSGNFIVTWESSTTILKILYDQKGKFISIKSEAWKDLNLIYNRN